MTPKKYMNCILENLFANVHMIQVEFESDHQEVVALADAASDASLTRMLDVIHSSSCNSSSPSVDETGPVREGNGSDGCDIQFDMVPSENFASTSRLGGMQSVGCFFYLTYYSVHDCFYLPVNQIWFQQGYRKHDQ